MVGWHHRLNGHEFEQAPGVGDGQGSLACCGSWGRKASDTPEQLNNNKWTVAARRLCPWDFPGKNAGVGLSFPSPGDPPDPGIEPASLESPA